MSYLRLKQMGWCFYFSKFNSFKQNSLSDVLIFNSWDSLWRCVLTNQFIWYFFLSIFLKCFLQIQLFSWMTQKVCSNSAPLHYAILIFHKDQPFPLKKWNTRNLDHFQNFLSWGNYHQLMKYDLVNSYLILNQVCSSKLYFDLI